jgi:hypothetical protein
VCGRVSAGIDVPTRILIDRQPSRGEVNSDEQLQESFGCEPIQMRNILSINDFDISLWELP